jgi:CubicO group peptidase (beta-lactamase class C family)
MEKHMTRFKKITLGTLLLITVVGLSNTYSRRWVTLQGPDVEDYPHLPSRNVENTAGAVAMPEAINKNWMRDTPFTFSGKKIDQSEKLDALLADNDTTAFIVIADGKVIDERYYHGYERTSFFKCFSISKSVLSALFGIAQSEGLISASDRLDKHIKGIQDPKLAGVKLQHLLDNVSGFKYQRGFAPWKQQPRMYYSSDIRSYVMSAQFVADPGTRFEGEDLSPLLVGVALESALRRTDPKITLSDYASRRLWQPLGAQYSALWNTDNEENGLEKVESGLVARAIDFARFGQLYLDEGKALGKQIVPRDWVKASTSAPSKGVPNLFIEGFYHQLWWGSFRPGRSQDDFYANGHFGQRIYVSPDKSLVMVRMGSNAGDINWTELLGTIADGWKKPERPASYAEASKK